MNHVSSGILTVFLLGACTSNAQVFDLESNYEHSERLVANVGRLCSSDAIHVVGEKFRFMLNQLTIVSVSRSNDGFRYEIQMPNGKASIYCEPSPNEPSCDCLPPRKL